MEGDMGRHLGPSPAQYWCISLGDWQCTTAACFCPGLVNNPTPCLENQGPEVTAGAELNRQCWVLALGLSSCSRPHTYAQSTTAAAILPWLHLPLTKMLGEGGTLNSLPRVSTTPYKAWLARFLAGNKPV